MIQNIFLNLTGKGRPSLNVVHENTLKCSKLADFFFRQQKIESAVNMLKTVTVKKIVDTDSKILLRLLSF